MYGYGSPLFGRNRVQSILFNVPCKLLKQKNTPRFFGNGKCMENNNKNV